MDADAPADRRSRRREPVQPAGPRDRHPTDDVVLGVVLKKATVGLEVRLHTVTLGDGSAARAVTVREVRPVGDGWTPCERFRSITIRAVIFDQVRALLDQAGVALAKEADA